MITIPIAGKDHKLNLPKEYLSYSQIDLYLQCPAKYEQTYVHGHREPTSSAPLEGTVMSKTLDNAGRHFLSKGKWPSIPSMQKYHAETARELWKAAILDGGKPKGDSMDAVIKRGKSFLQDVRREDDLHPVLFEGMPGCEYEIKQTIAGVPFLGYVDMIEIRTITDFKVARNTDWYNAHDSLQLSIYSHSLKRDKVRFMVFCKESMSIECLDSTRDLKKNAVWVEFNVATVAKAISSGSFPPCNPAKNKLCSKKFCQFYDDCYGACK